MDEQMQKIDYSQKRALIFDATVRFVNPQKAPKPSNSMLERSKAKRLLDF